MDVLARRDCSAASARPRSRSASSTRTLVVAASGATGRPQISRATTPSHDDGHARCRLCAATSTAGCDSASASVCGSRLRRHRRNQSRQSRHGERASRPWRTASDRARVTRCNGSCGPIGSLDSSGAERVHEFSERLSIAPTATRLRSASTSLRNHTTRLRSGTAGTARLRSGTAGTAGTARLWRTGAAARLWRTGAAARLWRTGARLRNEPRDAAFADAVHLHA